MVKSFFLDTKSRIAAFAGVVLAVVKKYGSNNQDAEETFLYQAHLDKKYSADGRWTTIRGNFKRLVADYVALGAPATLKSRGSKGLAEGKIPKVSNKYQMDEQQFKDLERMINDNDDEKAIISEIVDDSKNAVLNIYRLNELTFLEGLPNGVAAVGKNVSKGVEIRADYGYTADQKFKVTTANSIEIDDIQRLIDAQKKKPTVLWLDAVSLGRIKNSASFRARVSNDMGVVLPEGQSYPTLSTDRVKQFFASEWNISIVTGVEKTFEIEGEDGVTTNYQPWPNGVMVFAPSSKVGALVWSKTVEHTRRSKLADYAEADYILVSKFGNLDPIEEFTKAEAEVLPVINADGIAVLNTNQAIVPVG